MAILASIAVGAGCGASATVPADPGTDGSTDVDGAAIADGAAAAADDLGSDVVQERLVAADMGADGAEAADAPADVAADASDEGDAIAICHSPPSLPNGTACPRLGARCSYGLGAVPETGVSGMGECTCASSQGATIWSCSIPAQCGTATCSAQQACVTDVGGPVPPDGAPMPVPRCVDWPASCATGLRDCSCTALCGPSTGGMCLHNGDGSFTCAHA
jgi:hypothetical protein